MSVFGFLYPSLLLRKHNSRNAQSRCALQSADSTALFCKTVLSTLTICSPYFIFTIKSMAMSAQSANKLKSSRVVTNLETNLKNIRSVEADLCYKEVKWRLNSTNSRFSFFKDLWFTAFNLCTFMSTNFLKYYFVRVFVHQICICLINCD
jgi:hypothetical protein